MIKLLKVLLFLFITFALMISYHHIFSFKYGDGIYSLQNFYKLEDNSLDVLVLGSSHAFENVNTGVMWKEYGITGFDLGTAGQPIWNTYYFLREALKTQKPKLVIVECYTLTLKDEYLDESKIIKSVAGMHWSRNKIEALIATIPKDELFSYILEYIRYHNRYNEIRRSDFVEYQANEPFYKYWKGFGDNRATVNSSRPVFDMTDKTLRLEAKTETYYRMIIDCCKENNIPLMFFVAPDPTYSNEYRKIYNSGKSIAEENSIEFVDFNENYDEIGIDFSSDIADTDHLNSFGNRKFTRYLCDYIKSRYSIPDHRGKETDKYSSWIKMSHYIDNSDIDDELPKTTDIDVYMDIIKTLPFDYRIIVKVSGAYSGDSESIIDFCDKYKIPYDIKASNDYYIINSGKCERIFAKSSGSSYELNYGIRKLIIDSTGVYFDSRKVDKNKNGIELIVIDENNWKIADSVTVTAKGLIR